MIYIIIGISLVILLIIVILAFLIKRLIKILEIELQSKFVEKLQVFDNLIDKKEQTFKKLLKKEQKANNKIKKQEKKEEKGTDSRYYYNDTSAEYMDTNIMESYKILDSNFQVDAENIIKSFIKKIHSEEKNEMYNIYLNILEKLNFENTYNLLTLKKEEQLIILDNVLSKDEKNILKQYLKKNIKFNIKEFKNYLNNIIKDFNPTIHIYVGDKSVNYDYLNSYIKTIYNEKIFKGFIIIYQNNIYDYSLRN